MRSLARLLIVSLSLATLLTVVPRPPATEGQQPPPSVTGVSPSAGPPAGGTTVTITGANLTSPGSTTTVAFGTAPAANVTCGSPTTCTVVSPPGVGTVPVLVTVGSQTSALNDASEFTYTSITPSSGPASGDTAVTITGTGFSTAPGVTQFVAVGPSAQFSDVTCASTTTCTATTPALPIGAGQAFILNVEAWVNGMTLGPVGLFAWYGDPVLTALDPAQGPSDGGNTVTLQGEGFPFTASDPVYAPATVTFGGTTIDLPGGCESSATCTVTAPPGTGTQNVTITTPGGTTTAQQYTYTSALGTVTGPLQQPMTISGVVQRLVPPLVSDGSVEHSVSAVRGARVEALVGSTVCGTAVTGAGGRFQLMVAVHPATPGCGQPEAMVSFRVNGMVVGDPLPFRSAGAAEVELRLPAELVPDPIPRP